MGRLIAAILVLFFKAAVYSTAAVVGLAAAVVIELLKSKPRK